ncbi:MAG: hypothetical protein KGH71_03640 [Candidatus Micrarchaeota archaeon]|nr:hypothetical protein [Candidatus Micrarchaeota archaeon]
MEWGTIIILIILASGGYYIYSNPNTLSSLTSISSFTSPSIATIRANLTHYLNMQVTLTGGLGYGSLLFPYGISDTQGYHLLLSLPNDNGRDWYYGRTYSFTGVVNAVKVCTCPLGSNPSNGNQTAGFFGNVSTKCGTWVADGSGFGTHLNFTDCPISIIPYLNVTSANLQN